VKGKARPRSRSRDEFCFHAYGGAAFRRAGRQGTTRSATVQFPKGHVVDRRIDAQMYSPHHTTAERGAVVLIL
jgi:hypothetical protein